MTNNDLIEIGFKEIPHPTIGNAITYDLGRRRNLSASCVGTPNEIVFICEIDPQDKRKITDLVCVHNYDYDGYLTLEKINLLIKAILMNNK
jgi:hypothetical protein